MPLDDLDTLRAIMLFHEMHLSTLDGPVDEDTVLEDALSAQSIAGTSSQSLFKALTRRDIKLNGGTLKPWPADWPKQSVKQLAPKI